MIPLWRRSSSQSGEGRTETRGANARRVSNLASSVWSDGEGEEDPASFFDRGGEKTEPSIGATGGVVVPDALAEDETKELVDAKRAEREALDRR